MPIITGADSDFGALVVEEFKRRAQRVIDVGQGAPDAAVDKAVGGDEIDEGTAHMSPTHQKLPLRRFP